MPQFGVLANQTLIKAGTEVVNLVSNVQHGTLDLLPSGGFSYQPNAGYVGSDSFTYSVNGSPYTATVNIIVTDTAPTVTDNTYSVIHDTPLAVPRSSGVLANDTDAESDPLTAVLVNGPAHGQLTLDPSGSFVYTPNLGFVGTDAFTYQANDGTYSSAVGMVTINVTDSPPKAQNDTYLIAHDTTLTMPASSGVTTNDTDANNDLLTANLVRGPHFGTLTLTPSGAFSYTPNPGFVGTDSFLYRVSDGVLSSNIALITINVTDNPPKAVNTSFSTLHDTSLTVDPLNGLLSKTADPEGDPITLSLVNNVNHGTLTLNPEGSFTYVPNAGFVGTDTFTYQLSDGLRQSSIATVTFTVTNTPPTVQNDSYSLTHDTSLIVSRWNGLLANDSDADGDPITAQVVSGPAHGTLTMSPSGAFVYTPAANYVGSDSFTYLDSDGLANSNVATVTLTINGDPPPTVANDSYSVTHDTPLNVPAWQGILANDTSPSGRPLTPTLVQGPSHGTLTLNPAGSFLYVPNAGFTGTDSLTYIVSDGFQQSYYPATVTLNVTDTAPSVSTSSSYTVLHDSSLVVPQWQGVLANATDAENDPIIVSLVSGPAHSTLALNSSGSFTYTPNAGFVGSDSFTFRASDGLLSSWPVTAYINVTDNPPVLNGPLSYQVAHDQVLTVPPWQGVLANASDADGDPITAQLVSGTSHGTLTLSPGGSFVYTPAAGYTGYDSFVVRANDGLMNSMPVTVNLTVSHVNPTAEPLAYIYVPGQTLAVAAAEGLLTNATDPDGNPLTPVLLSGPSHGTLNFGASGSFTYTPANGFSGIDSFTYQVSDGLSSSFPATVTLETGSTPLLGNTTFTVVHDRTLTVGPGQPGLLQNAVLYNGQPLSVSVVSGPAHGTLTAAAGGSFVYTPNAGFVGTDTFTYQAEDGNLTTNTVQATITVTNKVPTANSASYSTPPGQFLVVPSTTGLLSHASDKDGDPLTLHVVAGPSDGTLTLLANGAFLYTPQAADCFGGGRS
jgi:hypothetical protein